MHKLHVLKKVLLTGLLVINALTLSSQNSSSASDFDIIYDRYWQIAMDYPSETDIDESLELLNADGSFSDLDYTSTSSQTRHLRRSTEFARAYQTEGDPYYKDSNIKASFFTSLRYWVDTDHRPAGWWHRHIGYLRVFGPGLFLMNVELQEEDPKLFNDSIAYLRWAYLQQIHWKGANGADQIFLTLPASILTRSAPELLEYKAQMKRLIQIQRSGDGIEQDWLYGFHSRFGRQLYSHYENEFLNSALTTLKITKGTDYYADALDIDILTNHIINGTQWYIYNQRQDPNLTGRRLSISIHDRFPNNLNLLTGLDTPQNSQILAIQDRVLNGTNSGSPKLVGNKLFWRFDYMIHRKEDYYVSSRLTSTRTVGNESGNGEGINNFYSSAGTNFLLRTGDEYSGNYFSVMNYYQWPGITVEQNTDLPLVDFGEGGSNGNAFAGGVSDGLHGAVGTIYDKKEVTAHKSWFYFDDEYVALGTGINQESGTSSVFTTLNQVVQNDTVIYSENNTQQSLVTTSGTTSVTDLDWVLQDEVGYVNLLPNSNFNISSDHRSGTNIFTVGIDHGINPTNASYAYAIYPNTNAVSIADYQANSPIQILSNTQTVQAVYHNTLETTQAIFYSPGSLTLTDGSVLTVNEPSAIMLKKTTTGYEISAGNPLCETSNPASMIVTVDTELIGDAITWDGSVSTINLDLPQGDFAGQSVNRIAENRDTLGVNDFDKNQEGILVYPNPTNNHITISARNNSINAVEIYSLNGQIALSKQFKNPSSISESVNVSELKQGLYLVKIHTTNGVHFKKIIKE